MKTLLTIFLSTLILTGGSVSAKEIETASYKTIKSVPEQKIEIRQYDPVILAETPMGKDGRNSAFRRLFDYISGDNVKQTKIPMTAPVVMDGNIKSEKIEMTAPVIMDDKDDEKAMMSFVLPASYTMKTAPLPTADNVKLRQLEDYNVAAITFSGLLSDGNVEKYREILMNWLKENDYKITGDYRKAGYDAPFTLPWWRRNEVLIPVELK